MQSHTNGDNSIDACDKNVTQFKHFPSSSLIAVEQKGESILSLDYNISFIVIIFIFSVRATCFQFYQIFLIINAQKSDCWLCKLGRNIKIFFLKLDSWVFHWDKSLWLRVLELHNGKLPILTRIGIVVYCIIIVLLQPPIFKDVVMTLIQGFGIKHL